jgi:hypothetical protein
MHESGPDGCSASAGIAAIEALHVIKRERKVLGGCVFCSPEGKYLNNLERYCDRLSTPQSCPIPVSTISGIRLRHGSQ